MSRKRSTTSGGIVIKDCDGILKIALAHDPEQGENAWVIPKGHVREGETLETTAIREIQEEIGVGTPQLLHYMGFITRKSIEDWGEVVEKDIHLYLTYALGDSNVKPADFETVVETGWFTLDEAVQLIPFKEDVEFLERELRLLSSKK